MRVRFRQCINLRFPNISKRLPMQIRLHCLHPYNASNTKNFLPNLALCSILMEKWFCYRPNSCQPLYYLHCPKPKQLRFLMAANHLRSEDISLLLAKQLANISHQSFEANHLHNKLEMVLPNNADEKKRHHANGSLFFLFLGLIFLILQLLFEFLFYILIRLKNENLLIEIRP